MILEKLLTIAETHARAVLIGLGQPLMPTWCLIDRKGNPHVIGTPWRTDLQKEQAEHKMRKEMRKLRVLAYSFVTEAWMARAPKEWVPGHKLEVAPRDNPLRKEVVIAAAIDRHGNELWRIWDIRRDHLEMVTNLVAQPLDKDSPNPMGWLAQMLR